MSFPHHDPNWESTARFIRTHWRRGQEILAPDDFWRLFDVIYRYQNTFLRPDDAYHWAVIHKGLADRINPPVLQRIMGRLRLVFANEVFVVLTSDGRLPELDRSGNHVRALYLDLPRLLAVTTEQTAARLAPPPFDPSRVPSRHVLPDQGFLGGARSRGLYALGPESTAVAFGETPRHRPLMGRG